MKARQYRLSHVPRVAQQIRDLSKRAAELGISHWLKDTLNLIVEKLQTVPLQIGDPYGHPKKAGSIIRVAIVEPVSFRYVVYKREKVVLWLEVKPLSRFFPE